MGKIGTGLGLAVTWNIMEEHGGTIQVKSEPHGTSFYLYLPATEKSSPQSETPTTVTSDLMGRGEHILVVDDDSAVRLLAKTILKRFGYNVVCVSSGEEALEYVFAGVVISAQRLFSHHLTFGRAQLAHGHAAVNGSTRCI